ncbi:Hypothetical predicted protein, partial [Pelobates cultripes]
LIRTWNTLSCLGALKGSNRGNKKMVVGGGHVAFELGEWNFLYFSLLLRNKIYAKLPTIRLIFSPPHVHACAD